MRKFNKSITPANKWSSTSDYKMKNEKKNAKQEPNECFNCIDKTIHIKSLIHSIQYKVNGVTG